MKLLNWWRRKIVAFECWLYYKVLRFEEGQRFPKWIMPMRYIMHPLWFIEKTHGIRRDMSRDLIYIYGVPLTGHMLHMLTGEFKRPTIARREAESGKIVYLSLSPGDIVFVDEKGEIKTDSFWTMRNELIYKTMAVLQNQIIKFLGGKE